MYILFSRVPFFQFFFQFQKYRLDMKVGIDEEPVLQHFLCSQQAQMNSTKSHVAMWTCSKLIWNHKPGLVSEMTSFGVIFS